MSDGGGAGAEMLRLWLETQGKLLRGADGNGWQRADTVFRAWSGFLESLGPTAAGTATPFDPSEWLKPEGEAGMTLLRGMLGGTGLGGLFPGDGPVPEWQGYAAALDRHRAITGAAWLAAFRAFAEQARRAREDAIRHGTEPPDWDGLAALWRQIADAEFAATQRSEEFLEAQATLLRAGLECRRLVRERLEAVADLIGLPTRAEVDDLAEQIHALRQEIRALKGRER